MTPKEEALASCDQAIKRSQQNAKMFRTLDRSFQAAIVVLGGLTPVLALWTTFRHPCKCFHQR
jgi:hypothetical protein